MRLQAPSFSSSGRLNLDEDLLPVQKQDRQEADQYEGDGIKQRPKGWIDDGEEPVEVDILLQVSHSASVMHEGGGEPGRQQFRENICGDGVGSENEPRKGPTPRPFLDLHGIKANDEEQQGTARGEHYIRTGPEFLVNGKPDIPQIS